jgi:hypothetical protein
MDGIKGLLNSEKALAIFALIVAATVLTALGDMSVAEWKEYTMWLAGIYVSGKTVQGVAAVLADAKMETARINTGQALPPAEGVGKVSSGAADVS